MINKLTHTTIYVVDQDRAKDFYVNKLGFECRDDARMGEFRWLTVGPKAQPDFRIVLMAIGSGPPHAAEHADAMKKLLAAGMLGGGVFVTDDLRRDYKEMTAKGVEFAKPPTEEPYGFAAVFKDDSGNFFSFNEEH
ncbi:MAG: VOC family protein [Deltaproteobacteria bacterium]|jgi:catechol 2,3-dioxygenase-like lactoylglutathione lyase family enzyme